MTETTTIHVCVTCLYALEYGASEALPLASEQRCKAYAARIAYGLRAFAHVWGDTNDSDPFSMSTCDACDDRCPTSEGIPLGGGAGERYAMTAELL